MFFYKYIILFENGSIVFSKYCIMDLKVKPFFKVSFLILYANLLRDNLLFNVSYIYIY